MKKRDKRSLNRKNKIIMDSSEVQERETFQEYQKGRPKQEGGHFGKKWFPNNKKGT